MEDINKPATTKQTFALKLSTGIDYRDQNLSFEEASKMIQEANKKSGYQSKKKFSKKENIPTILQYLASNECVEALKKTICNEIEIKSILSQHKEIEGAKKYVFLGTGCGFPIINWDKKNSRATRTIEKAKEIQKDIDNLVCQSFDKEVVDYLKFLGNSIEAIMTQNMNYKSTYDQLIVDYLEKYYQIEGVYVETRLD